MLESFVKWLWGYDFFISYRWESGSVYAVALAARLGREGFSCFLDRAEFEHGEDWSAQAGRALRMTQRLIVVAEPEAIANSPAVAEEVRLFARRSRRLLPIYFGAIPNEAACRASPILTAFGPRNLALLENDTARLTMEPSDAVIEGLERTHRLFRRRTIRRAIVLLAFLVLSVFLRVATRAYQSEVAAQALTQKALTEERRARLAEESGRLVLEANLLFATNGPQLAKSLEDAVQAWRKAKSSGTDTAAAENAVRRALAVMPDRVGEPWNPAGGHDFDFEAFGARVVVRPRDGELLAVAGELDPKTRSWRILHQLTTSSAGPAAQLASCFNRNARWVVTESADATMIWDALANAKHDTLRRGDHVIAVSEEGNVALVVRDERIVVWDLHDPGAPKQVLTQLPAASYVLSPHGEWVATEIVGANSSQDKVRVLDVRGHRATVEYSIASPWITQLRGMYFAPLPPQDHGESAMLLAEWRANSIKQEAFDTGLDSRNFRTGIWTIGLSEAVRKEAGCRGGPAEPCSLLIRREPFGIIAAKDSPLVAIIGEKAPVQILDIESQISFTLGQDVGPVIAGAFSPDAKQFLAVHSDGTAREWDVATATELLRITTGKPAIKIADAAFLTEPELAGDVPSVAALLTRDSDGTLQAWAPKPTDVTFDTVTQP